MKDRIASFGHALTGLKYTLLTQPNAQIHLAIFTCVLGAGWHFSLERWEWALILLAAGLVIGAEAMNTAVETLTDLVSPEFHPLAGRAKDVAASAVLICSLSAAGAGLFIFWPRIINLF
ncbi:diacylglycerol kinase family protein [Phaeodactylibacter luteus]|uniref:Diacylglycerol kinase family protein n=1 Tax=Phaeodactylibacter luteus TaxID=1564516 RepID=A0A5C6RQ25_9BACT|nr:diacylglycerol kinase family protein [Phaeodactylibacter luteus]TXB63482.1 diacylglycerol kinase family protein [Phaeodactylibacter luteus]